MGYGTKSSGSSKININYITKFEDKFNKHNKDMFGTNVIKELPFLLTWKLILIWKESSCLITSTRI